VWREYFDTVAWGKIVEVLHLKKKNTSLERRWWLPDTADYGNVEDISTQMNSRYDAFLCLIDRSTFIEIMKGKLELLTKDQKKDPLQLRAFQEPLRSRSCPSLFLFSRM
jgi:hypothetical protein